MIETRSLVKDYRRPWSLSPQRALSGVDLAIGQGEVFGILGPNGSGKTTLFKVLLGLVRPTSGEATVMGHPAGSIAARAAIGFLPEENDLYPFLTGREAVDLAARLHGVPGRERRRRVDEALADVGMTREAGRRADACSKGMARRLAVASALVARPPILLLDEPGSGLDPLGHRDMVDLIRRERARGATVVLASHLLAEVEGVCDRVALLSSGRVEVTGTVADLLERQGEVALVFAGLSAEAERRAVEAAAATGATLVSRAHPRDRLADLFQRVLSGRGR